MKHIGVDGCKKGWFAVSLNDDLEWNFGIFENIEFLFNHHKDANRILIDIPIGLPVDCPRDCDVEARKLLGKRASSVFPVPCREAVFTASYEEACRVNQVKTGKKFSKQTWNIIPKIKELDIFLRENQGGRDLIRESHPEICFRALSDGNPMSHSKRTKEGVSERLEVLTGIFSESEKIYTSVLSEYKRNELTRDDILDALVLALSASANLRTIPDNPHKDEYDLAMEIVFAEEI